MAREVCDHLWPTDSEPECPECAKEFKFPTKEDDLKARIEQLESTLVAVRDELWASNKRDCEEFIQMTIEQVEAWGVARHIQTHSFCLDRIHDALGA